MAFELLKFTLHFGVTDLVDILIAAIGVYATLLVLRRTRMTIVLTGTLLIVCLYVLALILGLRLTSFLIQTVFTVLLVAVIVLFQDDIRTALGRLATLQFGRQGKQGEKRASSHDMALILAKSLQDLAR